MEKLASVCGRLHTRLFSPGLKCGKDVYVIITELVVTVDDVV